MRPPSNANIFFISFSSSFDHTLLHCLGICMGDGGDRGRTASCKLYTVPRVDLVRTSTWSIMLRFGSLTPEITSSFVPRIPIIFRQWGLRYRGIGYCGIAVLVRKTSMIERKEKCPTRTERCAFESISALPSFHATFRTINKNDWTM